MFVPMDKDEIRNCIGMLARLEGLSKLCAVRRMRKEQRGDARDAKSVGSMSWPFLKHFGLCLRARTLSALTCMVGWQTSLS